jgi:hypothetical protein
LLFFKGYVNKNFGHREFYFNWFFAAVFVYFNRVQLVPTLRRKPGVGSYSVGFLPGCRKEGRIPTLNES